jgi:hypothetical protein
MKINTAARLRPIRVVAKSVSKFVMSVRPSLRMYQRGFRWKDFREICY